MKRPLAKLLMRSSGGARRGMTMIEILVAVTILAVMAALAYSGLAITIRSQREAEWLQERYYSARTGLEMMKREISMAFVSLHQAEDGRTKTLFDGEAERLNFVTSAHEPIRRDAHESDQLEVEYYLDRVDGVQCLMRRYKLYIDDSPGRGGYDDVVVSDVKRLEFEYYSKEKEDWQSEWTVLVEDAQEMLAQLEQYKQLIEQVKEQEDAVAEVGNMNEDVKNAMAAAREMGADKALDEALDELNIDELFLPNRVRIKLVLEDDDGREYPMETQVEIMVTDPLSF